MKRIRRNVTTLPLASWTPAPSGHEFLRNYHAHFGSGYRRGEESNGCLQP